MARVRYTAEQILGKLREVEVLLVRCSRSSTAGQACKQSGGPEQTHYRWRREYGGLKVAQAERRKVLAKENARLRKVLAELTLDRLIPAEATKGNC